MAVGKKHTSKFLIVNKVYVEHIKEGIDYKEIRKIDNRLSGGYELLATVKEPTYRILNEEGGFDVVDRETFVKFISESGYKVPSHKWREENKVLYSIDDYESNKLKSGSTFSIALNELYSCLGYELAVLDLDLANNSKEEYEKVRDLVYRLSNKRKILKTPNGFHIIIKRSEYEKLLNKLKVDDVKVMKNDIKINGVSVKADIFRSWKDVRYIVIPTKGLREMLGGGVLLNGNIILNNTPKDIVDIFEEINDMQEDGFINLILENVEEINNNDGYTHIQDEIINKNGGIKRNVLKSFCEEVGIDNLSNFTVHDLCNAISSIGSVDGTGRYNKLLRLMFYYVISVLVKKTKDYEDLKSTYNTIKIYEEDDEILLYEAINSIYPEKKQAEERVKQFVSNIDKFRDNIAQKLYEKVYDAVKKHMNKSYSIEDESRQVNLDKGETVMSLARKFHDLGVRRYGPEHVVDKYKYYKLEEFLKTNDYIKRSIPDSYAGIILHLKDVEYNVDGEKRRIFKLIPQYSTSYYDDSEKAFLLFVADDDGEIYCIKISKQGSFIEEVRSLDRPIFYKYYIHYTDDIRYNIAIKRVDLDFVNELIQDKQKAKEYLNEFVKDVFSYYTLNTKEEIYDDIIKKSLVAALFSPKGFILQLVGRSGVGKTSLANALGIIANNGSRPRLVDLGNNVEETKYSIYDNLSEGLSVVLDEIPKELDERLQKAIFTIVTTTNYSYRKKYAAKPIKIEIPAKIITTSIDVVDWAADARRRTIIIHLEKSSAVEFGLDRVEEYYENIAEKTTLAKIAFYSLIGNVELNDEEVKKLSKVGSIPDSLKDIIGRYFKAIGYNIDDVVAAFDDTNQSSVTIDPLYINMITVMASDDVREFIEKETEIFENNGEWYTIRLSDFLKLLYAKGMIKNRKQEGYLNFVGKMTDSLLKFKPDPSKFKETFMALVQGKIENGINYAEISHKITSMSKSQKVIEQLKESAKVPTSELVKYGVSISFIYDQKDKNSKHKVRIRYIKEEVEDKNEKNATTTNKTDNQPKQVEQKLLFTDEQLKENVKKQREDYLTYLEFKVNEYLSKSEYKFEERQDNDDKEVFASVADDDDYDDLIF